MRVRIVLFVCLLTILPAGCVQHRPVVSSAAVPTLKGDPAHPDSTRGWVDTKLCFGLGLADHPEQGISETEWRGFLDCGVTPRFPSGVSGVGVESGRASGGG